MCPECGKRLSRRGSLVTHMRTHTGERPFACPTCSRRFYLRSSMLAHSQQHRPNSVAGRAAKAGKAEEELDEEQDEDESKGSGAE